MKSIPQIFQDNREMMLLPEVKELIKYCEELEDKVVENSQTKKFDVEIPLSELVRDIYLSINNSIDEDDVAKRFNMTRIDYEDAFTHLKKYLEKFSRDYHFRL